MVNSHLRTIVLAIFARAGILLAAGVVWTTLGLADEPAKPPSATAAEINRLIEQLGDPNYFVRERAQADLAELGREAFDALTAAQNHSDLEIAHRARYLVRQIQIEWTTGSDSAAVKMLLKDYDSLAEPERIEKLHALANLPGNDGLSALCRIVRFERSASVSKEAAIRVLDSDPADASTRAERVNVIQQTLGECPRLAAAWLRAYAQSITDPTKAADIWQALIDAESATLDQFPEQSQTRFLVRLLRERAELLNQIDRRDDALTAMKSVIALEEGTADSLPLLMQWLVDQKAWNLLDEVAERFKSRFDQEPLLLYALAEARRAQGDAALTQSVVDRALALNPDDQAAHLRAGFELQNKGLLDWATAEYQKAIQIGPPGTLNTLATQFILAEMLHDLEDNDAAAKTLEAAVAAMEENVKRGDPAQNGGREPATVRARVHYLNACHLASLNQRDKQLEQLQEGLKHDPLDAEILIALYHLPGQSAEQRAAVVRQIHRAVEESRKQIEENPDDESVYNTLAWLISNTEGDREEALRCSLKSLELRPNEAGFLDTLGRCYYALGDLKNAVKYQTQAAQREPHTRQITKQLELFRRALQESQSRGGVSKEAQ